MRGKRGRGGNFLVGNRSIPACAGETPVSRRWQCLPRVYPRVCGGNPFPHLRPIHITGLSPRVRGKPDPIPHQRDVEGSIPACAGETVDGFSTVADGGVYPRVCGGNFLPLTPPLLAEGLSPRVRGKLFLIVCGVLDGRSIPACAGETSLRNHLLRAERVYPRVCGGNWHRLARRRIAGGLSPRVRGKPPGHPAHQQP